MLATFITQYEFRKGVISGGVLFFYWLLLTILGGVQLRSNIMRMQDNTPVSQLTNYDVRFRLCFVVGGGQLNVHVIVNECNQLTQIRVQKH